MRKLHVDLVVHQDLFIRFGIYFCGDFLTFVDNVESFVDS